MSNFINHKYKLIIIHIPKCGGSSIRRYSGVKFTERYKGYIPNEYINLSKEMRRVHNNEGQKTNVKIMVDIVPGAKKTDLIVNG